MEDKTKIADALKVKGAILPCHRCGQEKFSIFDGIFEFMIPQKAGLPSFVPVYLVVCNNCGAITPHARLALEDQTQEDK